MSIIETIKAEVERRYFIYGGGRKPKEEDATDAVMIELDDLLSFLDTLESEKQMNQDEVVINGHKVEYDKDKDAITMEEIPKDLEEAADEFANQDCVTFISRKKGFIAGAKWQAEQDKETIELAEDHAYLAGAVNEREKMLKEAVEGYVLNAYTEVFKFDARDVVEYRVELPANTKKVKDGDKVKLIIYKKNEK